MFLFNRFELSGVSFTISDPSIIFVKKFSMRVLYLFSGCSDVAVDVHLM